MSTKILSGWMRWLESDSGAMEKLEDLHNMVATVQHVECGDRHDICCTVTCQCRLTNTCCKRSVLDKEEEESSKNRPAKFHWTCGCSELCYTYNGRKVGTSRRTFCDKSVMTRHYRGGQLEGPSIQLDEGGGLVSVGRWRDGHRCDTWWYSAEGGSWLVWDSRTDLSVFIYPDLVTGLVARLSVPECKCLDPDPGLSVCKITNILSDSGILVPSLTLLDRVVPVAHDLTLPVLVQQCHIPDPYESKTVRVGISTIDGAGEGIFTTTHINKGQLVAYFAGVLVDKHDVTEKMSDYAINLSDGARLDIPTSLQSSYLSTLGHKACHSFQPNGEYSWAVHPRFGRIRSIRALRDIDCGEEIFTNYKYSLDKAPLWYKCDLIRFLKKTLSLGEEDVEQYIESIKKETRDDIMLR